MLNKSVIIGSFGTVFYGLSQWVIVFILAKFGKIEDVGIFTFNQSLVTPWAIFFLFSLRPIFISDTKNEIDFLTIYKVRILSTSIFAIIFLLFSAYSKNLFLFFIAIVKVTELLSDIIYAYKQKNNYQQEVGISFFLKGIIGLVTFSIIYYFSQNLILSYSVIIISNLFVLLFYDLKNFNFLNLRKSLFKFDFNILKNILFIIFPITIAATIHSYNINYPRLVLKESLGLIELGVFGAINYLNISVILVINSLIDNYLGQYLKLEKTKKDKLIFNIFLIVSIFMICLYLSFDFLGPLIIPIIYTKTFINYIFLFKLSIILAWFEIVNKFLSYSILINKYLILQLFVFIACIPITIIASKFYINTFNIEGIYYTLMTVSCFQFISYLVIFSIKKSPINV